MTIKIFVFNQLTHETMIDSTITVDGTFETAKDNHQVFREVHPDCQVNFVIDENNFIFAPPINMEKDEQAYDEGRMTWEEYCNKWYKGTLSGCNDDDRDGISDEEIDHQVEDLIESDWNMRDSVCH